MFLQKYQSPKITEMFLIYFQEMVSKRTLGDLFCDNVEDMAEAQLDVFLVPAADNPKVS